VTRPLDDDVLLAALSAALAPEPVEPGPEAMAALQLALDALTPDAPKAGSAIVVPFAPPKHRSTTWTGIHRLRHPLAAAVAVGMLATSGVAAAGVATDHLPGSTRNVAFALGLPVTSPALTSAKSTMNQLSVDLDAQDVVRVRASAAALRTELAGLSVADRASIQLPADDLLTGADSFEQSSTNGASSGTGGPTGSGASSDSNTSNGTTTSGTTSSNGGSANGTGISSDGSPTGTSASSEGSSGGTAPGTISPFIIEPADGSSGGSTTTTTTGVTPTAEPGDGGGGGSGGGGGDGGGTSPNANLTTSTTSTTSTS
jgi:hypothetical protein